MAKSLPYTILIDSNEQLPLRFGDGVATERIKLLEGDYTIRGFGDRKSGDPLDFIVERKSLADLAGSLGNGRENFEKEMLRMANYRFAAIVVEGTREDILEHRYQSNITPKSVLSSLAAFEVRYGVHVKFCGSPQGCATQISTWARHLVHGLEKQVKQVQG